jgi:hypothetical protein
MKKLWEVVGAVAGILGVSVAIFVFWYDHQENKMRLRVQLVAHSTLVDRNVSKVGKDVEVLYNGQKVDNFTLYQFKLSNSGRPVRSADYEEPVSIAFANTSQIITAQQTSSDPPTLKVPCKVDGTRVVFTPTLLNDGDWCGFEVAAIPAAGSDPVVTVSGRIAGLKQIEFTTPSTGEEPFGRSFVDKFKWLMVFQAILMATTVALQWWQRRRL